ncbi:MAG: putative ABC transporter permease [Eggerthellaceae bacterium]|nr:putative ABC transporter permease [Eggerthellaceae bacterium]
MQADNSSVRTSLLSKVMLRRSCSPAMSGSAKVPVHKRVGDHVRKQKEQLKTAKRPHLPRLTLESEVGYFTPKTWAFWRSLIVCFCVFAIVGHWLEIPYCLFMDSAFGIVDGDYAVWTDPWYHPYWIYGIGAVIVTLLVEPLKEWIVVRRKTLWGALLQTFIMVTLIAMLTELIMGWLVNQPDEFGKYPFWDNSQLPLNVFGQAWLVNDMVIGAIAVAYVWLLYPLICEGFQRLRPKHANVAFAIIMAAFAACCITSYVQLAFA